MKNEKLSIAQTLFRIHGIEVTDKFVLDLIAAINSRSAEVFEKDDFVEFYEGMGETGHGVVLRKLSNGYKVQPYFQGVPYGAPHSVGTGDMRGLSTIEKSLEYERIRSGV